jgi:hypothetical protein
MEDGPEAAEGTYSYNGRGYGLAERESEQWRVTDGDTPLGTLIAVPQVDDRGPLYVVQLAGEDTPTGEPIDDWQGALEYLIDTAVTGIDPDAD